MNKARSTVIPSEIVTLSLITILIVLIFAPIMHHWRLMGDYTVHNNLAYSLIQNPVGFLQNTPHFVYHILTAGSFLLFNGDDIYVAGVRVMVMGYVSTGLLIYVALRMASSWDNSHTKRFLAGLSAIGLLLVAPITLFTPDNLYFGYFVPHVYHNPTVNIVKPFAVILLLVSLPLFGKDQHLSWRWFPLYALLTATCLLAKPNFILSFVPALAIVTLYFMAQDLRRVSNLGWGVKAFFNEMVVQSHINWIVLLGGIAIPSILVLVYQALTWTSGGGITISPLRVFFEWTLHYEPNADQALLLKFAMSILFPTVVYILYFPKAKRNLAFNLAWVNFVISVLFAYLFVDQTVVAAGDFGWGAQIGVMMLFIVATMTLFQENVHHIGDMSTKQRLILLFCVVILVFHLVAGIYWYQIHLSLDDLELLYGAW